MKYLLTFLFILFLLFSGYTQISTFNKNFDFDMRAVALTSIIATDSCYYSTGIYIDTIGPTREGAIFVKFDLEGNPLIVKTVNNHGETIAPWFPNLRETPDSNFIVAGYHVIPSVNMLALLIKYDTNGDTLFMKGYDDPFDDEDGDYYRTDEVAIAHNGGYILGGSSKNLGDSDIVLTKVDEFGNLEYLQTDRTVNRQGIVKRIIPTKDNGYLIGGLRSNLPYIQKGTQISFSVKSS